MAFDSATSARYWLGLSLKNQKKFKEAEAAWSVIPIDSPRGVDAAIERMEIQFHVSNLPLPAIETANQLLKRDERLASPRRHRIHFDAMTQQRADLIGQIRKAIELQVDLPDHYAYLFAVDDLLFNDSVDVTRKWHEATPESEFLEAVFLARRFQAGWLNSQTATDHSQVEAYQETLREIEPRIQALQQFAVARSCLIQLAMDRDQPQEVGRLLAEAPDEVADDPAFWRFRAWYAARQGADLEAEKAYLKAIEINPLSWKSRHDLAALLRKSGQVERAGELERLAAEGSQLSVDFRRLGHVRDVDYPLLKRLSEYAAHVGDWDISNGIVRRFSSSQE